MNARNLAMCFAPALFNACVQRWKSEGRSGRSSRRRRARVEELSEKDLEEQQAAHECLTTMILSAKDLFTVRSELYCH